MPGLHSRLFSRIMSRNKEVYVLKIITLAIAFASSVLIILFSLNEFEFDRFHKEANNVFRILEKNTDEQYSGNRLSVKISPEIFPRLESDYKDSLIVSRVKIMNEVTVLAGDRKPFYDQKIHAADPAIVDIFSFEIIDGNTNYFGKRGEVMALLSARAAQKYTGTLHAAGKKIKIYTLEDTVEIKC